MPGNTASDRTPTDLPIEVLADGLADALAAHTSVVITSPPGSGKTTVVPLMLLAQPWRTGRILMLEPRRVATRAAARRIAQLLGEEVGSRVGYVTRTDRRTGPGVQIEVVTEGILTRRLQNDPELRGVSAVIFDEVHERNLNTDLGLALLLDARAALRPDLRVLAMSATVEAGRFARLLGEDDDPCPVLDAPGRLFPIDLRWEPAGPRVRRIEPHVVGVVRRLLREEAGDMLVFLPGIAEINRVATELRSDSSIDVHRLHGSLSTEEQDAALMPTPGRRKVVLSTDIAESSLTVEGVRIVVDSGRARAPRLDPRTGMTRLATVSISKASADQRAGRAGRLEPGVAVRLWSKMEHGARSRDIEPEIMSVDLAGLVLELAAWGTTDPRSLRMLDPPPKRAWAEALSLLQNLGALDEGGALTDLGRRMSELPLHPRLARMVAEAEDVGLAAALAAVLDDRDLLRGHPDELPVDIGVRLRVLAGEHHPAADGRGVRRLRSAAADLARRIGAEAHFGDTSGAGSLLAMAFPDRLAYQRGGPGRFQLRTGTTAWLNQTDPLAIEPFIVAADLDGKRKDARIRLAAAIDPSEVARLFARDVDTSEELTWHGTRLVVRRSRRLGGITLDFHDTKPEPGSPVVNAVIERLRRDGLGRLNWSPAAAQLRDRVRHMRARAGEPWPDWSEEALVREMDAWLAPHVMRVTTLDDLANLDLMRVLRSSLDHRHVQQLDEQAPTEVVVPSGRRVKVDYSGEEPRISVRVQEMYGATSTPLVGGEPIVVELLSPAQRPVQITRDLAGFWSGSWNEVRKDMAGRYPKHDWPEDPANASPPGR
jgi:ATP-dependent helicase HrpB